jgi:hypothetical protein
MNPFTLPRWKLTTCCGAGCAEGHSHGAVAGHSHGDHGPSRRRFLAGSAALGATLLATLAGGGRQALAQGAAMPAAASSTSPIEGLFDFHVHGSPDIFARSVNDDEILAMYKDRGVEGVVLKSHVALTADRAWLARRHVPGIKAFGGVALNSAAGGINPDAVKFMARMQGGFGRIVWLPTFDADHHVKHFKDAPSGVRVVDDAGKLLPAVREVMKICAAQKLILATGHASAEQVLELVAAAKDMGVERILVTHAQFEVVNLSEEQMKKVASMGAKLELCSMGALSGPNAILPAQKAWRYVSPEETAARVKAVGAQHFVLGTDLGQTGHPTPADGYTAWINGLLRNGLTVDQIKQAGRETPGKLLMG